MTKRDIVPIEMSVEAPDTGLLATPGELLAYYQARKKAADRVMEKELYTVLGSTYLARFKGRLVELSEEGFYVPVDSQRWADITFSAIPGLTSNRRRDLLNLAISAVPDLSPYDHLILFGSVVWDTQTLTQDISTPHHLIPWRSSVDLGSAKATTESWLVRSIAVDDGHYEDLIQSMAPMIMATKPDGVIWWQGGGSNGKSSLMEALHRIFPDQLSSMTVKSLTDGRDLPRLNLGLANISRESSEGRVDDTQAYKSLATHEHFYTHKFHSQEMMLIEASQHHIFSCNAIPIFNDKGYSARRRTFIVPFLKVFTSDPTFNDRAFTPETLAEIVLEMMRYAKILRDQDYLYKWSGVTTSSKAEYDIEANNSEEYAKELVGRGVVAFDNFVKVRTDYENWCLSNGYVPLGMGNMRRAITTVGYNRITVSDTSGKTKKIYRLTTIGPDVDLIPMSLPMLGFYTAPGFSLPDIPTPAPSEAEQGKLIEEDW